jgi:hypothetical protein
MGGMGYKGVIFKWRKNVTKEQNGNGLKARIIWYMVGILVAIGAYFFTSLSAQMKELSDENKCQLPRIEWAARNVYVDNQIAKLREEQAAEFRELRQERAADMTQLNSKLDKITEHLLNKK